jgi:hypothetical protein
VENNYIAYSFQFQYITNIITDDNEIMIVNLSSVTGQRQLIRFREKDHQTKLETFFRKHNYEATLTFAKNQGMSEQILAEISML